MHNLFDLVLATPEIVLLVLTCLVLVLDAFDRDSDRHMTFMLTMATLLIVILVSWVQWSDGVHGRTFSSLYVADSLGHFLKILSALAVGVTLIYGRSYSERRDMTTRGGELYSLTLIMLLGEFVMISAGSMLTVYLGVEVMSFALYALVALRRDHLASTEAAMKYYVLGCLASGILLYGMSMIYGATGEVGLAEIAQVIRSGHAQALPLAFGVVFIVAGLGFKLTAAPFHMWTPDVYQGAPTTVTLLVGAAPKFAAFCITLRLLIEALHGIAIDWQPMLLIMAVLSLALGNIVAIAQTNFKRMLAYSAIGQMGYVFLGLLSGVSGVHAGTNAAAYGASLFYVVIYVLTTLSTFGLILLLSRQGFEAEEIADLKGLNRRNPLLAGVLLLAMFSLAGIPPLSGFYAKLIVLQAVVSAGYVWLAVFAVMCSLIGAFYYLRVVKMAYFDEPEDGVVLGTGTFATRTVMSLNGLLVIGLGILPGALIALCERVITQSLVF
ncbi:MAG TPA: NADH-quinone oxidoreductase subunit NuoN [Castellaniella sp.]|uniref:NADH-quinone oxidoreductase subunit NuoN n=1 Tax=Castellaniella sp. TaxID=1955812 RepID=UPI002EF383B5